MAIQEAKDLKILSLDVLIGNLQTYELRRSSQQQEENKKDHGIDLKIMEEDSLELDEEDMAMITRKFKKFLKKTKEGTRREHLANSRTLTENSSQGVSSVVRWTT